MNIQEFIRIYVNLESNQAELAEMVSQPDRFSPVEIESKRASNKIFADMVANHFPLENKSDAESEAWE